MSVKHVCCLSVVFSSVSIFSIAWADAPSHFSPPAPIGEYSNYSGASPGSGLASALAFAQNVGVDVSGEARQKLDAYPQAASLNDVKKMTSDLGLPVEEKKVGLDALFKSGQPAILQLQNPEKFVLFIDSVQDEDGTQWLRLLDSERPDVTVVSRSVLEPQFSGVALVSTARTQAGNAAQIQLDSPYFHFPIRNLRQPIQHSYKFTNTGKSDLEVKLTRSYCGCGGSVKFEVGSGTQATIKPGESGEVRMTYGVPNLASVNETTSLITNDPARPVVYLTIRGEAARKLEVSTQQMSFEAQKGKSQEQTFEVTGLAALMLGQPMLDNDKFSATAVLFLADADKAVWRVTVKLNDKVAPGQHQATLSIPTNDPNNGTITIPVSAKVL